MKTKEKAYAKINLSLKVGQPKNGFHPLDSVVCSVNLYDELVMSSRKDDKITLRVYSSDCAFACEDTVEKDNACKAVRLFSQTFNTPGADVVIYKNIPVAGGMGGSSADAAAALRGMSNLYGDKGDLSELASLLGSDTAYMLSGGFARLRGRGEIITPFTSKSALYAVAVYAHGGVNTAKCYAKLDELRSRIAPKHSDGPDSVANSISQSADNQSIDGLIDSLEKGSVNYELISNDLFEAAISLNPEVLRVKNEIAKLSPKAVCMSGSGSTVYGLFDSRELCDWAADKLRKTFDDVYSLQTVNP